VHDAWAPYDTYLDADAIDLYALDKQIQLYRSAAQIGLTQTSARSSKVMKKHNAPTTTARSGASA
jgi:hypothetical protein